MVRARFGTPSIGREWLVGAEGTAATMVASEGSVSIDGALWVARSEGSRVDADAAVTVVAVDDSVLEVVAADARSRS